MWWKFWNLMKFLSFEILYIFFIFQILNFKFFLENFDPLAIVYRPPYPWYIDPSTHGILNPLPMVYWPPYPWYFDPPTHDILTSLHIFWLEMGGGGFKIPWGFNLPYRGGSIFNKGVQYTMDVNWPRVQFTMGFKVPYDTGTSTRDKWRLLKQDIFEFRIDTKTLMYTENLELNNRRMCQ